MEIQPRSFGDSLGDLIKILGKVWRPLLMPALITAVVVAIASFFAFSSTGALDFFDIAWTDPEAFEFLTEDELLSLMGDFFIAVGLIAIISTLMYGFIYLVSARAVGEAVADRSSARSITGVALTLMLAWVFAMVLVMIGSLVGFVLLVLPGIWFGTTMSMIAPVMALEGSGPIAAMRRSYDLVKGNWWETFGFLLLVGLIGGAASQLTQVVAVPMFLLGDFSLAFGVTIALSIAVQGLIIAAVAVAASVWYLNLRARRDGPYLLEIS